jgi:hypothetical protein
MMMMMMMIIIIIIIMSNKVGKPEGRRLIDRFTRR